MFLRHHIPIWPTRLLLRQYHFERYVPAPATKWAEFRPLIRFWYSHQTLSSDQVVAFEAKFQQHDERVVATQNYCNGEKEIPIMRTLHCIARGLTKRKDYRGYSPESPWPWEFRQVPEHNEDPSTKVWEPIQPVELPQCLAASTRKVSWRAVMHLQRSTFWFRCVLIKICVQYALTTFPWRKQYIVSV